MFEKELLKNASKFMSFTLRHNPEEVGVVLDAQGWVSVEEFIRCSNKYENNHIVFSEELVREIVKESDKQRFALSSDGTHIRANQGHSIQIDLGLAVSEPPEFLYHGSAEQNREGILKSGLLAMKRHDVHLSFNTKIALSVGQRYGKPLLFKVLAQQMFKDGYEFRCTSNNVWLTKTVPAKYLLIVE